MCQNLPEAHFIYLNIHHYYLHSSKKKKKKSFQTLTYSVISYNGEAKINILWGEFTWVRSIELETKTNIRICVENT